MSDETQVALPRYKCHKEVEASKIVEAAKIVDILVGEGGAAELVLAPYADSEHVKINVSAEYGDKHAPTVGGYYVRYKDGYESFSPADAFEDGYALVEEGESTGSEDDSEDGAGEDADAEEDRSESAA